MPLAATASLPHHETTGNIMLEIRLQSEVPYRALLVHGP